MAESSESPQSPTENPTPPTTPPPTDVPRRSLLTALSAGCISLVLGLVPFAAGAVVFLDPLWRRKGDSDSGGEDDGEYAKAPGKWIRVASLEAIPADGTPGQFPVIDDLVDAWSRQPNQPVGAVYLRRVADAEPTMVEAFNAICPHAGCFVAFSEKTDNYQCPCHNSAFALDGSRIRIAGVPNPTPRPLDKLPVDQRRLESEGDVWVKFANFYTGKEEQVPK